MKKQTIVLLAFLIGVFLLIGIGQFLVSKQKSLNLPTSQSRSVEVPTAGSPTLTLVPTILSSSVTIDFGDGKKVSGKTSAKNAYEALVEVAKLNKLTVEVKQFKYGKMVVEIGQKENSTNYFWSYLVNGKSGQIAADSFLIYPNDKVEWVYKK